MSYDIKYLVGVAGPPKKLVKFNYESTYRDRYENICAVGWSLLAGLAIYSAKTRCFVNFPVFWRWR